jgi:hypothetical protein
LKVDGDVKCVAPRVEANCGKGEHYMGDTNECVFKNDCPQDQWNLGGMCMPTSCSEMSTELMQDDAYKTCKCPSATHWDAANFTCVANE